MGAGLINDNVYCKSDLSSSCHQQHWGAFQYITEIFILVPALLGLKGNLEMTLASRLSTAVRHEHFLSEAWHHRLKLTVPLLEQDRASQATPG